MHVLIYSVSDIGAPVQLYNLLIEPWELHQILHGSKRYRRCTKVSRGLRGKWFLRGRKKSRKKKSADVFLGIFFFGVSFRHFSLELRVDAQQQRTIQVLSLSNGMSNVFLA